MAEELRLWAMDGVGGAEPLHTVGGTDSERLLEDTLVNSPDMMDEGLRLIGRQVSTESGPLDLLGVDANGQLVVFELKRGRLQRDSVAQIIDYASYLDNLGDGELLDLLTRSSKSLGIESFGDWYAKEFESKDLSSLRPVQITLVGLGVDPTTDRMVRYLANGGMSISLLTFRGYHHNGQTLLARQVQVKVESETQQGVGKRRGPSQGDRMARLEAIVEEARESWPDGHALFNTIQRMFRENLPGHIEGMPNWRYVGEWAQLRLDYRPRSRYGRWHHLLGAVQLWPPTQTVECIFYPQAVERCLEQFTQLRKEIPFHTHPEIAPEKDEGVIQIKFNLKTMADWELHGDKLTAVTQAVYEASADLRRE